MSAEMNDFERTLAQLRPAPAPEGAILFAMGRSAGLRSARRWQVASLILACCSVMLGWFGMRPEPLPNAPAPTVPKASTVVTPDEPPATKTWPTETDNRQWSDLLRRQREALDVAAQDSSEFPSNDVRPMRAGAVLLSPIQWVAISGGQE